jgi:hypothetical protein
MPTRACDFLLQGIIGEGYERLVARSAAAAVPDAVSFAGREEEYRMADYEDTQHIHNSFGVAAAINPKRRLGERAAVAFPLSFSRHAALSAPLQAAHLLGALEVKLSGARRLLAW